MGSPGATESASAPPDWWWVFDPRHSLRARAALLVGISTALFTLLISWIAGNLLHRALEHQAGTTFETLAFQVSDKIDRVIYERYRELQLAASLAPFRSENGSPTDRRRVLEALQAVARDFAWIGFADTTGKLTATTKGILEGTPMDSRTWFRSGRERAYAGSLNELPTLARELETFDDDRSPRFLDLAVPVQGDGRLLGVLGAHLHWEWAREVQNSVVAESARRDRIGVTVYSATGDVLLDSGASGWTQPPDAPAISDPRRFRGFMMENAGTTAPYLTGFSRSRGYRDYRGLGWMITVRQPADRVFAPVDALRRSITGWGFFFCAALVTVSWVAADRIARRIRAVGTAAHRIREGDILTVMPRAPGTAELGQMCGALGQMVEDLREKQESLTAENTRLTTEAREKTTSRQ